MIRVLAASLLGLLLLVPEAEAGLFRKKKQQVPKARYGVSRQQHEKRVAKLRRQSEKRREQQRKGDYSLLRRQPGPQTGQQPVPPAPVPDGARP